MRATGPDDVRRPCWPRCWPPLLAAPAAAARRRRKPMGAAGTPPRPPTGGRGEPRPTGSPPASSNVVTGTIDSSGTPPCITQPLLLVGGQAQCTVVEHRTATGGVIDTNVPSCDTASQGPCWSLITSPSTCPGGGLTFTFDPDPANPNPNPSTLSYDYSCDLRSN